MNKEGRGCVGGGGGGGVRMVISIDGYRYQIKKKNHKLFFTEFIYKSAPRVGRYSCETGL